MASDKHDRNNYFYIFFEYVCFEANISRRYMGLAQISIQKQTRIHKIELLSRSLLYYFIVTHNKINSGSKILENIT